MAARSLLNEGNVFEGTIEIWTHFEWENHAQLEYKLDGGRPRPLNRVTSSMGLRLF